MIHAPVERTPRLYTPHVGLRVYLIFDPKNVTTKIKMTNDLF
jgi:hypothetical protein